MTLLELALLLILIFCALKIIAFAYKRTVLLFSILGLNRLDNVEVEISNALLFYSPKVTARPVCRVKVYSKYYAVRLFNGKGSLYAAHIVNDHYATVFMKSGGAVKARLFVRSVKRVTEGSRVYFPKTVFLPPLPENTDDIPVLLFNPAPRELTYVTKERTSIKVAFTGDTVCGMRIFTKTTFANFIDRDTRGFWDEERKDIYSYDA